MAFKVLLFAALVAVARAGILGYSAAPTLSYAAPAVAKVAYSPAPAVSYSSVSSPIATHSAAPTLSYATPAVAKVAYSPAPAVSYSSVSSPIATHSAAPAYAKVAVPTLSYSAPAYKVAAPIAYSAPVSKEVYADVPANYEFGYSVNDPHTGDSKSQHESRHGDVVQGSYSLIESDGSKRIVEYSADAHNGFNAVVHREPVAAPVKAVVPVVAKVAAPIAYGAPSYNAPVTKYSAAPAVSYSSVSAPIAAKVAAPAYYH